MTATRAGRLRHKIKIETRVSDYDDELGQEKNPWTTLKDNKPAFVQDLSGRDLERARQNVADATVSVETRWMAGLDTGCRIIFRDRTLHVAAVIDTDNRKQIVVCLCGERKS